MKPMSQKGRVELIKSIGDRYRSGTWIVKRRILDEFVAITGYHHKHAIRVLRLHPDHIVKTLPIRPRRYGTAVSEALLLLWEASDRVCSKRLRPLIPTLLTSLERHGHMLVSVR